MGKVDLERYGSTTPKIGPDDLEDEVALVTVEYLEEDEVDDRPTAKLFFEETGDKALFLNKTMLATLVERLGDDPDKWKGATVPIEVKKVSFKGEKYDKVYVVPADEWDHYIKPKRRAPAASKGTKRAKRAKGRARK